MMIRSVILVAVILLAGVCLADQDMTIADKKFEFGKMPQNTTIKHQFWLYSTGSDTLRIDKLVTGCTCIIIPLEQEWIAPGDSMLLTLWWDIGRRIGNIGRYPRVEYDDATSPARMFLTGRAASGLVAPNQGEPIQVRAITHNWHRH